MICNNNINKKKNHNTFKEIVDNINKNRNYTDMENNK